MSTSSKLSKGVSLSSQSRQIVNNVYEFCCIERDHCKRFPRAQQLILKLNSWLLNNQINFDQDMVKAEFLELVKKNLEATMYTVDKMAGERGHQVVRLADCHRTYHCTFNPIEIIWAQLKGFVRSHNRTGRQADIMRLVEMTVETMTPHYWEKCRQHVLKIEEGYWRSDHLMEDVGTVCYRPANFRRKPG